MGVLVFCLVLFGLARELNHFDMTAWLAWIRN
jgi:hypothetical protein